jgi:hypothetical protein
MDPRDVELARFFELHRNTHCSESGDLVNPSTGNRGSAPSGDLRFPGWVLARRNSHFSSRLVDSTMYIVHAREAHDKGL